MAATAQVLLQRFYCKRSFTDFNVKVCTPCLSLLAFAPLLAPDSASLQRLAAASVFLSTKLEECPRRARDVINVFHRLDVRQEGDSSQAPELLDLFGRAYDQLKAELVRDERLQLREFGFACHVEHAHPFVLSYAQLLELGPEVAQAGWGHVNDCGRTTLVARYRAHVLACGALFLAARNAGIALPEGGGGDAASAQPPWWTLFDAKTEEVHAVARVLTCLYAQPRAAYVAVTAAEKTAAQHTGNGLPHQQQERQIAVPLPHGGAIGVLQPPPPPQQQQQQQQQQARRSRFDAPGGAELHVGRERQRGRKSRSRSRSRGGRRHDSRERPRRRHSRSRSRERRRSRSRDRDRR